MAVLIVSEQYVLIYHMWSLIKYSNTLNNVGWWYAAWAIGDAVERCTKALENLSSLVVESTRKVARLYSKSTWTHTTMQYRPSLTGAKLNHATNDVFPFLFFLLFSTREAWLYCRITITLLRGRRDLKHHSDRWTMASRILQGISAVLSWYTRHRPQITWNRQFKEAARNSTENSNLLSCTYRGM